MMTIFLPGKDFAAHLKRSKPEEKNWLEKFRIGTCQVNDPIMPTPRPIHGAYWCILD